MIRIGMGFGWIRKAAVSQIGPYSGLIWIMWGVVWR